MIGLTAALRRWWDGPRFCEECGEPLDVEQHPYRMDPATGEQVHKWVTSCPMASWSWSPGDGASETWYGGHRHTVVFGLRPRWHARIAALTGGQG